MVTRIHVLDGIARLHALMVACPDLRECMDGVELRTKLMEMTATVRRGPVLALPWRETRVIDGKMLAAGDDSFDDL